MTALQFATFAASSEPAPRLFPSPEEARQALLKAVQAKDHAELMSIFGPVASELEPGDPVEQANEFDHFARHLEEGVDIVKEGEGKAILAIGAESRTAHVP